MFRFDANCCVKIVVADSSVRKEGVCSLFPIFRPPFNLSLSLSPLLFSSYFVSPLNFFYHFAPPLELSRQQHLGTDAKVAALVRKNGLYLKQNTITPGLRGGPKAGDDGARRIAMHYKFALDHAFEQRPDVREKC